jgi:hypothetical protein
MSGCFGCVNSNMRDTNLAERLNDLLMAARTQKQLRGVIRTRLCEEDFIDLLNASYSDNNIKTVYLNKPNPRGKYNHWVIYVNGSEILRFIAETENKIYDL